ncbi:hypothetical protein K443DRAFT_118063 [Laccaria amethystina LaAM-08-1]|uniref:Uncharacterized protein n=1 Tax=Laccaria amethystina LaAM-08-1 TaxID=1095629 RepID=A0A0C9WGF7_9AGAR|nr:hypothetical protein K443DRAFT_118063 [Laccaria amethystina LaAM-08-1]
MLSHVTTTLFSQLPQPSTIGHKDPPPQSRNGDDRPPTFTGPTPTIDEWPRGPTTMINGRR